MTDNEYKTAITDLVKAVIAGAFFLYGFFILAFIFDIH
tara:strand:- start:19548 stop:19661 length:114 start_codon:yes stop_codon:yes gene_type:complete